MEHVHGPTQNRDAGCGFTGNSDMYGLGIRLGIYMQWLSALIVYFWYSDGYASLLEAYIIFLFAVMVVIIVQTVQAAPTYAVEIVVLTYIIIGGAWAMVVSGLRLRNWRRTRIRFMLVFLILGSCALYCSWFWTRGLRQQGSFLPTPCGSYMFLFARVSIYNRHLTTFFTVVSFYSTVMWVGVPTLTGAIAAASSMGISRARVPSFLLDMSEMWWIGGPLGSDLSDTSSEGSSVYDFGGDDLCSLFLLVIAKYYWLIFSTIVAIYCVLAIELTLYWNSVRDVYTINTTGQLLPFVIGLVGLAKCIYKSVLLMRQRHNRRQNQTASASNAHGAVGSVHELVRVPGAEVDTSIAIPHNSAI